MQSVRMTRSARRERVRVLNEPPRLTVGEEVLNAVSHGSGAALAAAGLEARHEVSLGSGCRIDFVCGGVGIEVKKGRVAPAVMRR